MLGDRRHMSIRVRGSPKPAAPLRRLAETDGGSAALGMATDPHLWPEMPAGAVNDVGILAPGPDDDEAAQG